MYVLGARRHTGIGRDRGAGLSTVATQPVRSWKKAKLNVGWSGGIVDQAGGQCGGVVFSDHPASPQTIYRPTERYKDSTSFVLTSYVVDAVSPTTTSAHLSTLTPPPPPPPQLIARRRWWSLRLLPRLDDRIKARTATHPGTTIAMFIPEALIQDVGRGFICRRLPVKSCD